MRFPTRRAKSARLIVETCRILLAITFIFSGFVKVVDPWGTALKIGEYLAAFDMEWLYAWRFGLSIWLTGAELMMGLMLLFRIRLRLISIFAFISMSFFTGLTLVLAIWNPVDDCGCFGDAIKLTNWETFIKNMILFPMSIAVMWGARKMAIMPTLKDLGYMLLFGTISFGIGVYSFCHLPLIDFLPYKVGTNLVEAMNMPSNRDVETVLIYRNKESGKTHRFDIADTTWHDDKVWEYIDTETIAINSSVHPSVRDFVIFDSERVITDEVLADSGVVYMVCASDPEDIKKRCADRLESAVKQAYARGYRVMLITARPLRLQPEIILGEQRVECYNMDATTIKTMLRAKVGVVVLKDGVIVSKENCRDMLGRGELSKY